MKLLQHVLTVAYSECIEVRKCAEKQSAEQQYYVTLSHSERGFSQKS